jgi:hypothetical protein
MGQEKQPAGAADPSSLNADVGPGLTDKRKRMRFEAKLFLTATTAGLTVSFESMLGYFL